MDTLKYITEKLGVTDGVERFDIKEYNRKDLYGLFAELGLRLGCEVGVRMGKNARIMFNKIPDAKLFLVDTWTRRQKHLFKNTCVRLADEIEEGRAVLFRKRSLDIVKTFDDESLDFVYIDAHHMFDSVIQDIIHWEKKVRPGGIVAGHDYTTLKPEEIQVIIAVDAYVKAHEIKPLFITRRDKRDIASWFWVKT